MNRIDHVSVGAADLESGTAFLRERLGAVLSKGSKHDTMATHNRVAKAGEGCFLELIAIDPDAPAPAHPRWFGFDLPATRERLADGPRALGWVVATDDLDGLVAASPVDLGEIVFFQRGTRSWRLTVRADGTLPEEGLIPAFIEWSPGPHPSAAMDDLGMRLETVELTHPDPSALRATLAALGVAHLATVTEGPRTLALVVDAPVGRVSIG